jgi:hypothetical protein
MRPFLEGVYYFIAVMHKRGLTPFVEYSGKAKKGPDPFFAVMC